MIVEYKGIKGSWRDVADACNTTINRSVGTKEPSAKFKYKILLAEHSPIRRLYFKFKISEIPYWVSVHFTRHKFGIEHWVRTQRTDRTSVNRDNLHQGNLVEHEFEANAQAIINISRKRLCNQASKETREAWIAVLESLKETEPELYDVCVPDCIYRGRCREFKCCEYDKTSDFLNRLIKYDCLCK